jgi:O-antigen ligase
LVIDARTESRMADIAFIIAFIYVSFKLLSLKQFSIAFLIVMSIAYIGFSNNISVKQKFEKIYIDIEASLYNNNHNSSVGFRSGMILIGFEILKDNFWLGTGDINLEKKIDSIRKQSPDKFGKTIHRIKSFHNDHITLLVTYGVIGYGLFLLFIYKFFMFSLGNLYMDVFKNSIILTYLSLMMGYEYITDKTNGVLFALIIALFTVYVINKKSKKENVNA